MKIKFGIPGPITPKQRPRRGKYGNYYTPPETQAFERKVSLLAAGAGLRRIPGNVKITLICKITKRKDLDNVLKSCIDGLKRYFNDMYVTEIHAEKISVKKDQERVIVTIEGEKDGIYSMR